MFSNRSLLLDVETRPDPEMELDTDWWERVEDALEPPGNTKDPLKLEDWRNEKLGKARNRMALSSRTACIAMVGVLDLDDDEPEIFMPGDDERLVDRGTEARVLHRLRMHLGDYSSSTIVGWNVRRFDLPMVLGRCAMHRIDLPQWFPNLRSYRNTGCVDLLDDIYGEGPLSEWRYLLFGEFKEVEGADLQDVSLAELAEHLRDDLIVTKELARRTEWAWRNR